MAFKYTAAALAASSLLVSAAPAPRPAQQHQPEQVARPWWDPSSYGYNYNNDNDDDSYPAQPKAEDYWGRNGFDGEAWNNAHRVRPYPGGYSNNYKSRSQSDSDNSERGPRRGGSVFSDDDGDDDTTYVFLNPFNILGGILPLPDLGSLLGDLLGYPGADAPRPYRPRPQGYPKGVPYPKGYPQGQNYPNAYPQGQNYPNAYPKGYPLPGYGNAPKGYPRPSYPKGVAPGAPLVSNLPNGAGQASLGLIGGGFSLDPVAGLPTPGILLPGSPAGPFPKGWPPVLGGAPPALITPAPAAPGIIGALPGGEGSQSLGIIGTSFSLDGGAPAAPTPAAPLVSPLPSGAGDASLGLIGGGFSLDGAAAGAAPAITPAPVAPLASSAGAQSLGLLGAGFSLDGAAAPAPTPAAVAPVAAGGIVAPLASSAGAQSIGLLGAGFSLDGAAGAATPTAAAAPIAPTPAAIADGATLSAGPGTFSLDDASMPAMPAMPDMPVIASDAAASAAALASPSPAAALTQTDSGVAGDADAALGGLSSSATIN